MHNSDAAPLSSHNSAIQHDDEAAAGRHPRQAGDQPSILCNPSLAESPTHNSHSWVVPTCDLSLLLHFCILVSCLPSGPWVRVQLDIDVCLPVALQI